MNYSERLKKLPPYLFVEVDKKKKKLVPINDDFCILMQSTGLNDKNGKEIFEGDVVKYYYDDNDWVIFVFEQQQDRTVVGIGFDVIQQSDKNVIGHDIRLYRSEEHFEIIGNIHENPELLEEK